MKSRISVFLVLAIAFVIVCGGMMMLRRTDADTQALEEVYQATRLQELEAERVKGEMLQEINNQDDDAYIMQLAKNQYGYLMPGEILFRVSNPEALYDGTPEATIIEVGQ